VSDFRAKSTKNHIKWLIDHGDSLGSILTSKTLRAHPACSPKCFSALLKRYKEILSYEVEPLTNKEKLKLAKGALASNFSFEVDIKKADQGSHEDGWDPCGEWDD
jgi:hypothetical protein